MIIQESLITIVSRRALMIGIGFLYYYSFLYCYSEVISPLYSYAGMRFYTLPFWAWLVSLLFSLIPLLWMPINFKSPSDTASWFIYLCLVFPSSIVAFMVSRLPPIESVEVPIAVTASFILFEFIRRKAPLFNIPKVVFSPKLFGTLLAIVTITLSFILFAFTNFQFKFSIGDIYTRRLEARSLLSHSIVGYGEALLASVCIPITFFYGIDKKKWQYIVMSVFAALVIFSLKGSKGALLSPLVLGFIYFLVSSSKKTLGLKLIILFTILVIFSLLEPIFIESSNLASYVIRRKIVIPSYLTTYYLDFFSHNPFVMMKDSIFGWIIPTDPNYFLPRARIIGYEYFGNLRTNANANIWASAYADFGYFGMAVTSILAALVLRVVDSLAGNNKFVFASVCSAFIGLVWTEGAFYTSLLSNGIIFLIIMLWIYPTNDFPKNEGHERRDFGQTILFDNSLHKKNGEIFIRENITNNNAR